MVKIEPQTTPDSQRQLALFAARNEFVSFQVAFHGGQTGMAIDSVSLPALEGPGHIKGHDPDVDEFVGETRLSFPFVAPPGEARAVWVDVHVP